MDQIVILIVVGVTSLAIFGLGTRRLTLSENAVRRAVGKVLEGVGLTLVFLLVNLGVGVVAIFAARVATQASISLYPLADETLLGLSLLQALIFQRWWEESAR